MRLGLGFLIVMSSFTIAPIAVQAQTDTAREHFEAGVRLLDDSKFAGAAQELEQSLALRESPPVLYNLGLAYRGLGRYKDAIRKFERFLAIADATRYATQRERVKAELEQLRAGLAHLVLTVSGGASQIEVDGAAIGTRDGTFRLELDPGRHELAVRRPGHRPVVRTLEVGSGEKKTLKLDASSAPLPARIVIEVDVADADISLDGRHVGRGRYEGKLGAGVHQLKVTARDREPHERKLRLRPGETARQDVRLQREDSSVFGSWWFWTGGAVVVGAAVAGVILLQKPDPEEPQRGSLGVLVEAIRR